MRTLYKAARKSKTMSEYQDYDNDYVPWICLGISIVAQAESDYRSILRGHVPYCANDHDTRLIGRASEYEDFFHSSWYKILTLDCVDSEDVIESSRKNKKRVFTKRYPKE